MTTPEIKIGEIFSKCVKKHFSPIIILRRSTRLPKRSVIAAWEMLTRLLHHINYHFCGSYFHTVLARVKYLLAYRINVQYQE